jgi:hypothetical protein
MREAASAAHGRVVELASVRTSLSYGDGTGSALPPVYTGQQSHVDDAVSYLSAASRSRAAEVTSVVENSPAEAEDVLLRTMPVGVRASLAYNETGERSRGENVRPMRTSARRAALGS